MSQNLQKTKEIAFHCRARDPDKSFSLFFPTRETIDKVKYAIQLHYFLFEVNECLIQICTINNGSMWPNWNSENSFNLPINVIELLLFFISNGKKLKSCRLKKETLFKKTILLTFGITNIIFLSLLVFRFILPLPLFPLLFKKGLRT